MPMIRIRRHTGLYQFNTADGTTMADGEQLVEIACDEGNVADRQRKLESIVGRMLNRLPPSEWLEIVDAYSLEEVK